MPSMTNYKFGDIILIPFPFTNHQAEKKRPAVIINSNDYQSERPDVILMPITSQIKAISYGEFQMKNWQVAGLLKPSIIKPVIATLENKLILKILGELDQADQNSLRMLISKIIG